METLVNTRMHRRNFQKLALALALPAPLALAALGGRSAGIALAQSTESPDTSLLAPTPECGDADDLTATLPQTAGPFYTPDTPERRSLLEPEMPGTRLMVSGYVYSTECQPIPARCSISGKLTIRGSMTTRDIACAVISSRMRMVASSWRPSCQGSTRRTVTSTSLRRRRISHRSSRSSTFQRNRPMPRTGYSTRPGDGRSGGRRRRGRVLYLRARRG